MAFTRNQAKKQQQNQQHPHPHPQGQNTNTNTNITTNTNTKKTYCTIAPIDFVDASIEWRKNKIKRENCTFEYI